MDTFEKKLQEFLSDGHKTFLPHISLDCVIFGFHDDHLKVLLLKWKNAAGWCIPGGFIKRNESVDHSAKRVLKERTGLQDIFLKQFKVFGEPNRERGKKSFKMVGPYKGWLSERFITIGYWALVEFSKVKPRPDWLSEDCQWWDVNKIPKLIYDHNEIVLNALDALRASLNDQPVGYNLLPETFTMPELQRLYETILGSPLDRRNFQKKMLAMDILERLPERKTGGAHKAPFLYKFDKKKYERAMKKGITFGLSPARG